MKKEDVFTCAVCGDSVPAAQQFEFDGQALCQHCLEEETVVCSVCGERLWNDDNAGNGDMPLCQSCYDRRYTSCIHCGALLRVEDARYDSDDPDEEEPLCDTCYTRVARENGIHDYAGGFEGYSGEVYAGDGETGGR